MVIVDKPESVDEISYGSDLGTSDHVSVLIKLSCSFAINCYDLTKNHKGNNEEICSDLSLMEWTQTKKSQWMTVINLL